MSDAAGTNLSGRVTASAVAALAPGQTLRDIELRGFGVRRRIGAPSYFLQTRVKGRLRWLTIGSHGSPWTPATARKEALRLITKINEGSDPAEAKRAARVAETFAEIAEAFLAAHGPRLKPRTREEYERLIRQRLLPAFASRRLADISPAEVTAFHNREATKPRTANFALAVLSKIMSWAEAQGLRPDGTNPCRHVDRYTENRRQRFLSDAEVERLVSVYMAAAVRLLLLTGARLSEILTLKWQYVDLQRGLLLLPDSKTGQKPIFLNDEAKAVLGTLPRLPDNAYVICGTSPGAHLVNLQKPWRRIRVAADLDDVRLHDLRHSFASIAAASGASLLLIGKLLGHSSALTTERYAHLVADPVRDVNQKVGAAIGKAMRSARDRA
jgi:integrase